MASSDFPRGVACHFGLRLIGSLTAAESPPTAQDLDRSLTLPSVHAVARNTGDDGCLWVWDFEMTVGAPGRGKNCSMETTLFLDMTEQYLLFKGKASEKAER
jgi:hypothetical protein